MAERPTQPGSLAHLELTSRYRDALTEALTALRAFCREADANEIKDRYGLVYIDPQPEVRLSLVTCRQVNVSGKGICDERNSDPALRARGAPRRVRQRRLLVPPP